MTSSLILTSYKSNMSESLHLGLNVLEGELLFRVWSPEADGLTLHLYDTAQSVKPVNSQSFSKEEDGIWSLSVSTEYMGMFYTYQALIHGQDKLEVPCPYAKAVGLNGHKGAIIDIKETDPKGWSQDQWCATKLEDAIIYEVHVRDFTISSTSSHQNKGKYLGFIEEETSHNGCETGIDHLTDLGVTHVQLLPIQDFKTVDEAHPALAYNWGYDPQNYNVPEGSYATDPFDPKCRIKELKTMIQSIHTKGIGIIMDVVYTHTYDTEDSTFQQLTPGYFYRFWENGHFSNGSGCGNEIASEREMVRRYIIDSLTFWMTEYHIDGFRFDLMAIFDSDTVNLIAKELRAINPNVILYGEGWVADQTPMPAEQRAIKYHTYQLDGVGTFCDEFRDGLKGQGFPNSGSGFIMGDGSFHHTIKFGIVGATHHPEIDWNNINYTNFAWTESPLKCINFVSCHDGHTLYDWLQAANKGKSEKDIMRMQKLALSMVLLSYGVPLIHAGCEFLRSKQGHHNSYNLPDDINGIDWSLKSANIDVHNFVKALVEIRSSHDIFRISSREKLQKHLKFVPHDHSNLVAYQVSNFPSKDGTTNDLLVVHNGSPYNLSIPLDGEWNLLLSDSKYNKAQEIKVKKSLMANRISTTVLMRIASA